ncbi:MAG: transcription antitermination factor NusB [Erysipelotrichaceae bacterium]|nr:transcription antitermination factor NusB [Erysipelotrichaceae bacterium]
MTTAKRLTRHQQREIVMTCLYQYLLRDIDLDTLFEDNLQLHDKDSIPYIVETTVETINNMDDYIERIDTYLTEWSFDRLGYVEKAILLMATHEILHDGEKKVVYVNEAVELAKTYCDDETYKLINGVLDQL